MKAGSCISSIFRTRFSSALFAAAEGGRCSGFSSEGEAGEPLPPIVYWPGDAGVPGSGVEGRGALPGQLLISSGLLSLWYTESAVPRRKRSAESKTTNRLSIWRAETERTRSTCRARPWAMLVKPFSSLAGHEMLAADSPVWMRGETSQGDVTGARRRRASAMTSA